MTEEEQLRKQLDELEKSKREISSKIEEIEKQKNTVLVEKSNEMLDKLVTSGILDYMEHDRISCSDENPCNEFIVGYDGDQPYSRCKKCLLLQIIKDKEWDKRWIVQLVPKIREIETYD